MRRALFYLKIRAGLRRAVAAAAAAAAVVAVVSLLGPPAAQAQYVDGAVDEVLRRLGISDELSVGGTVGMVGELYGVSGIRSRRPGASGRLFARAQASGYGLSYGLNMMLTTEQFQLNRNFRRQPINQIDLRLKYKWLETNIGTVSPRLSQYSLNGATLRGGYLKLTPGNWRFTYAGGEAQRAVQPDLTLNAPGDPATGASGPSPLAGAGQGAYQRWVHTARIGYGNRGGNYLDLVGLYGYDDAASLDEPGDLAPVSNANASVIGGVRLFEGHLRLEGQATASALVGDTRAPLMETRPGLLYRLGLVESRLSSQMNYAGRFNVLFHTSQGQIQVDYERIQPGFRSLGLGYLRSDHEVIRVRPRLQLFEGKLRLGAQMSERRNNLAGDLPSTQRRQQTGLNAQVRLFEPFFVSTSYSRLVNESNAIARVQDVGGYRQVAETFTLSPSVTLQGAALTHSAALTATVQRLDDERAPASAGGAGASDFNNYSGTLSYTLGFATGMSVGLTGNAMSSQRTSTDLLSTSLNANASHSLLDRALRVSLGAGWARNRLQTTLPQAPAGPEGVTQNVTQQLTATSNLIYEVPVLGDVSLRLRALRSSRPEGGTFNEVQSTLRYEYNF